MKISISKIRVKNYDQVAHLRMPLGVEFLSRDQVEQELIYSAYASGIRRRLESISNMNRYSRFVAASVLERLVFVDLDQVLEVAHYLIMIFGFLMIAFC